MKRTHSVLIARTYAIVLMLTAGLEPARAQNVANDFIGEFEIAPAGSLEWEILDRLASTRQYEPGDLPRLARLTVLESIAMYQNLRSDLRETSLGARLEGEMSQLWDAAEVFSIGANYPPPDLAGLNRSRALLADVNAAFRQLDATLGRLPGSSPRAALHLQDIARLLPVMNEVFEAMDAEAARPIAVPVDRAADLAALRDQSRRLAEDLRGLVAALNALIPAPVDRDALIEDVSGLLELVQGFDRTLAANPSNADLEESLRLVRRRMWTVEVRVVRTTTTPSLGGRWRQVRRRIDAISDFFGLPRAVSFAPATVSARGVDRKLVAQVDRALAALDEFLSMAGAGLRQTQEGSAFEAQVGRLRLDLLQLRQRAIAKDSPSQWATLLREIEVVNRQLIGRARPDGRITRGTSTLKVPDFQGPSQAVGQLSEPAPKP